MCMKVAHKYKQTSKNIFRDWNVYTIVQKCIETELNVWFCG